MLGKPPRPVKAILRNANCSYIEEGVRLLELTQKAVDLKAGNDGKATDSRFSILELPVERRRSNS